MVPSFVLRTETVARPLAAEPVATATVATTATAASMARRKDRALMEDLPLVWVRVFREDAGAPRRSVGGTLGSRVRREVSPRRLRASPGRKSRSGAGLRRRAAAPVRAPLDDEGRPGPGCPSKRCC